MTVVKLSTAEMRAFAEADAGDPAISKLKRITVQYATEAGGLTLAVWRLAQGQFFGLPTLMTPDEVAKRLKLPVSEVQQRLDDVDARARAAWRQTTEYRASIYDKGAH